jgi:hypothetical protein
LLRYPEQLQRQFASLDSGIVAVLPGQPGLAVFSTRLDEMENSERGIALCESFSRNCGAGQVMGQSEARGFSIPERTRVPSMSGLHRHRWNSRTIRAARERW